MEIIRKFLMEELNIADDEIMRQFELYNELILSWNSRINLISRKQQSIEQNLLDSVFFLSKFKLKGDEYVMDTGTGGGFPGIPLKILFPGIRVTLLDSTLKKINALSDIVKSLGLNDTEAVRGRAEEVSGDEKFRFKYDAVVTLYVSSLVNIYKWCKGFLRNDGYMICLKGGDLREEIRDLKKHNPDFEIIEYSFPGYGELLKEKKLVIVRI